MSRACASIKSSSDLLRRIAHTALDTGIALTAAQTLLHCHAFAFGKRISGTVRDALPNEAALGGLA